MPGKLILVDGSNHAFRAFHAMPRLTAGGRHTGALLGFANLLRQIQREMVPDYVAIAFDRGRSFRNDLFPDYKGHRPDMPPELREQWPAFEPLVEAWGFRYLAPEGFEADDIIGTLALRYASPDLEVTIVSGDKDFSQLVRPSIRILDLKKDQRTLIGPEEVQERFGVPAERVIDVLALWGDASDNVPGVPGIGEKKGAELIRAWGSLDAVLAHASEVKGKVGESLRQYADQARLSRDLVTLRTDMDLPFGLEDLAVRPREPGRLRAFLVEYQLRSHLAELEEVPEEPAGGSSADRSRYRTVATVPELLEAVAACRRAGRFAFDTETTSLDPLRAELVGLSLCWSEDDAVYIPVGHREGVQLSRLEVMAALGPLLADPSVGKFGQNSKYDVAVLRTHGFAVHGLDFDTLLGDYLLETNRDGRSLDDLALRYLGHRMISYAEVTADLPPGGDFSQVPIPRATEYAAEDAHVAWLLDRIMHPRLEADGLLALLRDIEIPVVHVLEEMERNGILLDRQALAEFGQELDAQIARKERDVHDIAGHPFNINSPKQLAEVLFDEVGLESRKKTRTGRSTDAQTLELLAAEHPLPAAVLEYRSLAKLRNTYVEALPGFVSPVDGRVHTSFHQAVAATGRLSSQDPNLQNIPIRTPEGRRIRACFVPAPGRVFLSADYSQIELRVLAAACGEGPLVEAFRAREDIHRATAATVFGVSPAFVSPDQRRAAKAINFGIIYGMGAFRLANDLGIGRRQAQKIIDDYFERYPQVRACMDAAVASARELGYAVTRFGRRRVVPDLHASLRHVREAAERVATNTPIQGTAADIMKIAMARVHQRLVESRSPARLLLQVHDELLLEVPMGDVDAVSTLVREEMTGAVDIGVPLEVGVGVGRNWDEAH